MPQAPVTIGIVGGGRVGAGFAKFLKTQPDDAKVVGIQTSTKARQDELSSTLGIPAFGTVEELMEKAKPTIVAVVNANEDHYAATMTAMRMGAHVFCEKPMAPTLEESRLMVEAQEKYNRVLQIGFEYMHGTMTSRLRQLINDGFFGQVTWASVLDSRGHWASDSPSTPIEKVWKLDRKRGGGIIFHCGIHQLDMIRCYLGPIEEITAYRPPVNALSFYPSDVPDNVTLMLRAKSGAVCNFQVFHNRAPCYYRETNPWSPDWRQIPGHAFDVSVVGTKGSCEMQIYKEKLSLFKFDIAHRDTTLERIEDFAHHPANKSHHDMSGLLLAFIRNIAAGKGAIDPASEAYETMRIAYAAEDAIAKNGTVRVADYK